MPESPNLKGIRVGSAQASPHGSSSAGKTKPNLDGIRYSALGRAHKNLKQILEKHGQHLSNRVLSLFRETLGRMGGTLRLPPTLDGIRVKKSPKEDGRTTGRA